MIRSRSRHHLVEHFLVGVGRDAELAPERIVHRGGEEDEQADERREDGHQDGMEREILHPEEIEEHGIQHAADQDHGPERGRKPRADRSGPEATRLVDLGDPSDHLGVGDLLAFARGIECPDLVLESREHTIALGILEALLVSRPVLLDDEAGVVPELGLPACPGAAGGTRPGRRRARPVMQPPGRSARRWRRSPPRSPRRSARAPGRRTRRCPRTPSSPRRYTRPTLGAASGRTAGSRSAPGRRRPRRSRR